MKWMVFVVLVLILGCSADIEIDEDNDGPETPDDPLNTSDEGIDDVFDDDENVAPPQIPT